MSNLLSELQNNEVVLMLYLAGELPLEDRIEVQQMVERDSALRAQCIAMDRLLSRAALSFGTDTALAAAAPAARARQRLSPVFRQWTTQRLSRPAPIPELAARRTPWFMYPLGAAAIILVAIAVFWSSIEPGYTTLPSPGHDEVAYLPDWTDLADDSPVEIDTIAASRQADSLIATFDASRQQSDGNSSGLVFAATELTRLQEAGEQMDTLTPSVQ